MSEDIPRLGLVRRYLSALAWKKQSLEIKELDLFTRTDLPNIEIILPQDPTIPDTGRRIKQAIRTIADIEDQSFQAVSEKIKGLGFDLLEGILPNEKVFAGAIKLRVAEGFLRSTHNLMVQAALSEYSTEGDGASRAALEFADDCQFGHTFKGSFGFRILSPLGPNPNNFIDDSMFPPERHIMRRLEHGLAAVERSYAYSDPSILIKDSIVGLGPNAYEAVARLLERVESDSLRFNFIFSPEWSDGRPSHDYNNISISASAVPLLREAARSMRKVDYDLPETRIQGRVVRLMSKNLPTDLFHPGGREISVLWESRDYGDVSVRARLSADQYLAAIYAHEQGREVSIFGILEPYGSGFRFLNIIEFDIVT